MKRTLFHCILALATVFSLPGCGGEAISKSRIIGHDKFVSILKDIHLTNSYLAAHPTDSNLYYLDSIGLYQPILKKYGVSTKKFEITVEYYSRYPEKLEEVYELILKDFTKAEAALKVVPATPATPSAKNLWNQKTKWILPRDGKKTKIEFNIPLAGIGMYTINVKLRVLPSDQSVNPRLSVYFWQHDGTATGRRDFFNDMQYAKDTVMRTYSVNKFLTTPSFSHLRGCILDNDSLPGDWSKFVTVDDISITYQISQEDLVPE